MGAPGVGAPGPLGTVAAPPLRSSSGSGNGRPARPLAARGEGDGARSELARFVRDIVREELAAADPTQAPHSRVARPPSGPDSLTAEVLVAIRQLLGEGAPVVDEQGDLVLPLEGTTLYVRVLDYPPSVLVFCPVLIGVPRTPALLERLNELNDGVRFVRFTATEGGIVADHELFGEPFAGELLHLAVRAVTGAASRFGPELQQSFGGSLFLVEDPALAPRRDSGGYL
jgi:hypothetical protein